MNTPSTSIQTEIDQLHDAYVEAVNIAVAAGDEAGAHRLAREFDTEVLETVRRRIAAAA